MKRELIVKRMKREEREAGFSSDDLLHYSYDQLADGGRRPHRSHKIDPESERTLRRLFDILERRTV